MDPRVKTYLERDYPIFVAVEKTADGRESYVAGLLDLPGCLAQGSSEREAKQRLDALKPGYFEKLLELNVPIPEPTQIPSILPGLVRFYDEQTGAMVSNSRSELQGESVVRESKLEPVS